MANGTRRHVTFSTDYPAVDDFLFRNGIFDDQVLKRFKEFFSTKGVLRGAGSALQVHTTDPTEPSIVLVKTGTAYILGERVEVEAQQTVALVDIETTPNAVWIKHVEAANTGGEAIQYDASGDPHTVWFDDSYVLGAQDVETPLTSDQLLLANVSWVAGALVITDARAYLALAADVADDAVGADQIATAAVGTTKLADAAVTEDKLADAAVTQDKLADAAVGADQIAAGAVTSTKIPSWAVTEAKLANAAVTTSKLGTGAVTEAKLAVGTGVTHIYSGTTTNGGGVVDPDDPLGEVLDMEAGSDIVLMAGLFHRVAVAGPIRTLRVDYHYVVESSLGCALVLTLRGTPRSGVGDPVSAAGESHLSETSGYGYIEVDISPNTELGTWVYELIADLSGAAGAQVSDVLVTGIR